MINRHRSLALALAGFFTIMLASCGASKDVIDAKNAATFEESVNRIGLSLSEDQRILFAQDIYALYSGAKGTKTLSVKQLYTDDYEDLYRSGFRGWERGGYSELVQSIGTSVDGLSAEDVHELATELRSSTYTAIADENRALAEGVPAKVDEISRYRVEQAAKLDAINKRQEPYISGIARALSNVRIDTRENVKRGVSTYSELKGSASIVNVTDSIPEIEPANICAMAVKITSTEGERIADGMIEFPELKPGESHEEYSFQFQGQGAKLRTYNAEQLSLNFRGNYRACSRRRVNLYLPNQGEKELLETIISACDSGIEDQENHLNKLNAVIELLDDLSSEPRPVESPVRISEPAAPRSCRYQ